MCAPACSRTEAGDIDIGTVWAKINRSDAVVAFASAAEAPLHAQQRGGPQ